MAESSTSAIRPSVSVLSGSQNTSLRNVTVNNAGGSMTIYNSSPQDERTKIAQWLSPLNFRAIQNDTFSKSTSGTGAWFLSGAEFQEWTSKESGTIWGVGIPGAGKTILASITINHIGKIQADDNSIEVVFAYCRYNDHLAVIDILAALVRQLVERHDNILRMVKDTIYRRHMAENTHPTESELRQMLQESTALFAKFYIIIDALDEVPPHLRYDLVQALLSLRRSLMVTSRPLDLFKDMAPQISFVPMEAHNEDILRFITDNIRRVHRLKLLINGKEEVEAEIVSKVVEKSHGMFLLAALQIESLKGNTTVINIRKALDSLPIGVDEQYSLTLRRIESQSEEESSLAKQAILWIIYACHSLDIGELQEALAVKSGSTALNPDAFVNKDVLISICCGLVTIDKQNGTVRLIHYTAHEFFKKLRYGPFYHAHSSLAITCATYLSIHKFSENGKLELGWSQLDQYFKSGSLLRYAHQHWGFHTRKSQLEGGLPPTVLKFIVEDCQQYYWEDGEIDYDFITPLHLAACYGLSDALQHLGADKWCASYQGYTPLHLTCIYGDHKMVQMLLQLYPAGINQRHHVDGTALTLAASKGHELIVELLLACDGIDINACDFHRSTALMLASCNGHEGIVKLLLACDSIDINACSFSNSIIKRMMTGGPPAKKYGTALTLAASKGHELIVKSLLARDGIDVNACDARGSTPLMWACSKRHEEIMKLLLACDGIDVNARSSRGGTVLTLASSMGHEAIVRLLLTCDRIDVNVCGPLEEAYRRGHEAIVKLLLSCDGIGNSVGRLLTLASERGDKAIVKLLLARDGIDVNACNPDRGTPLTLASERGDQAIVKLLLACDGIDVNACNPDRGTPLTLASGKGHQKIVTLLLACDGIDANACDSDRSTALILASGKGHGEIVKLLLACDDIDVNAQNSNGSTALLLASKKGHKAIVKLLLECDASIDVNAHNSNGSTALMFASQKGHEEIAKLLLSYDGIDLNARNSDWGSFTAMELASSKGYQAIVNLLRDAGTGVFPGGSKDDKRSCVSGKRKAAELNLNDRNATARESPPPKIQRRDQTFM